MVKVSPHKADPVVLCGAVLKKCSFYKNGIDIFKKTVYNIIVPQRSVPRNRYGDVSKWS